MMRFEDRNPLSSASEAAREDTTVAAAATWGIGGAIAAGLFIWFGIPAACRAIQWGGSIVAGWL